MPPPSGLPRATPARAARPAVVIFLLCACLAGPPTEVRADRLSPVLRNGQVLLPLRQTLADLGGAVTAAGDGTLVLALDGHTATVDPVLVNGTEYVAADLLAGLGLRTVREGRLVNVTSEHRSLVATIGEDVAAARLKRASTDAVLPVVGQCRWSDSYNPGRDSSRRSHGGQDLMAPKMRPLVAAFDGVVMAYVTSAPTLDLYGDNGLHACYRHINNDTPGTDDGQGWSRWAYPPGIGRGTRVCAGEHIAYVGDSGNAENVAPHLHFELEKRTGSVNPAEFLRGSVHLEQPVPLKAVASVEDASGTAVRNLEQGGLSTAVPLTAIGRGAVQISDPWLSSHALGRGGPPSPDAADYQAVSASWPAFRDGQLTLFGAAEGASPEMATRDARCLLGLMRRHGDGAFMDVFERFLYNVALADPARYQEILRNLGAFTYVRNGNHIYVNLYVGSEARIPIGGGQVAITQETRYPWSGRVTLTLHPSQPLYAMLLLRVPSWATGRQLPGERYHYLERERRSHVQVWLNGVRIDPGVEQLGYLAIPHRWQEGDQLEIEFPVLVRRAVRVGQEGMIAVERGPVVYAAVGAGRRPATLTDDAVLLPTETPRAEQLAVTLQSTGPQSLTLQPAFVSGGGAVWLERVAW